MTDLLRRLCPYGHEVIIPRYVWMNFIFHRCKVCKSLYQAHEFKES